MGNNNVYGQGHFITPNKVQKPTLKVDENSLNIENVFGKVNVPMTRPDKADDSKLERIRKSRATIVCQYERQIVQQIKVIEHSVNSVLRQSNKEQSLPESRVLHERKVKTEITRSPINCFLDIDRYASRQDSPVKQENKKPEQSRVQIFQSRLQNKYFKISQ